MNDRQWTNKIKLLSNDSDILANCFRLGILSAGIPAIFTVPSSGRTRVAKVLRRVVFPAPLGPIKATISPFLIEKEREDKAIFRSKCFDRLFTSSITSDDTDLHLLFNDANSFCYIFDGLIILIVCFNKFICLE